MTLIKNKHPIELAFNRWIGSSSRHQLDMNKFYCLVKSVIAYSRSEGKRSYDWLKQQIANSRHNLSEDDIVYFCEKFVELQKFNSIQKIPLTEIRT